MEVMRALDARGHRRHRPEHAPGDARRRVPHPDRRPSARHRRGTRMTATTEAPQRRRAPRPPAEFARMERSALATWWSDTCVFARRNIEHIRQIPEKLLDVTLQPLMFVLLFAYVFGGAIAVQGGNYREYIIAGILVQSLAFGLTGPATAISERPHGRRDRPVPLAAGHAHGVSLGPLPRRAGRHVRVDRRPARRRARRRLARAHRRVPRRVRARAAARRSRRR